jgi:hypothetical protein
MRPADVAKSSSSGGRASIACWKPASDCRGNPWRGVTGRPAGQDAHAAKYYRGRVGALFSGRFIAADSTNPLAARWRAT